jgi:hypothetical protein
MNIKNNKSPKGHFRTVNAFPLYDYTQGVSIRPGSEWTEAAHTEWMQGQIDAGTIVKRPEK